MKPETLKKLQHADNVFWSLTYEVLDPESAEYKNAENELCELLRDASTELIDAAEELPALKKNYEALLQRFEVQLERADRFERALIAIREKAADELAAETA